MFPTKSVTSSFESLMSEGCDSISIHSKNGTLSIQMTATESEFCNPSFFDAYEFGSSCERGGLGAGAIAGIAIGSIAIATSAIIFVVVGSIFPPEEK